MVVQSVRTSACHAGGRGFESHPHCAQSMGLPFHSGRLKPPFMFERCLSNRLIGLRTGICPEHRKWLNEEGSLMAEQLIVGQRGEGSNPFFPPRSYRHIVPRREQNTFPVIGRR